MPPILPRNLDPDVMNLEANTHRKAARERLAALGLTVPFPEPCPVEARLIEDIPPIMRAYRVQGGGFSGLTVLAGVLVESDGKLWYHVSFSRRKKMPDYEDQAWVKKHWIGADRWAIAVLPEKKHHVNFHPFTLHLWHCLEGRPIPEFSKYGMV